MNKKGSEERAAEILKRLGIKKVDTFKNKDT